MQPIRSHAAPMFKELADEVARAGSDRAVLDGRARDLELKELELRDRAVVLEAARVQLEADRDRMDGLIQNLRDWRVLVDGQLSNLNDRVKVLERG